MASPAYSGKGQPPVKRGWLSGLTSWWNNLTPGYATCRGVRPNPDVIGYPGALSSTSATVNPSGAQLTANELALDCAPGAAKS